MGYAVAATQCCRSRRVKSGAAQVISEKAKPVKRISDQSHGVAQWSRYQKMGDEHGDVWQQWFRKQADEPESALPNRAFPSKQVFAASHQAASGVQPTSAAAKVEEGELVKVKTPTA